MTDEMAVAGAGPASDTSGEARKPARPDPIVLREFPGFGRCRVRLVKSSTGPRASIVLDVREYAKSDSFEGFTRRGIRIASLEDARRLREALEAIEGEQLLK